MPQSFHRREDGMVFRGKKNALLNSLRIQTVGDTILVKSENDGNDFIAEIKEIKDEIKGTDGDMKLQVAWFYRPEEAAGGRKMFHGSKELFKSDHQDEIDAGTIKRKCQILTIDAYQALPRPIKDDVYFTRVFYSASSQKFRPSRWVTYCTCKMPYNPDLDMVQCSFCKEYFHVHCLQSAGHLPPGPPPDLFDCHQCKVGWTEPPAGA